MNNIGKNIKKLRNENGLTQEQLAEKLLVTRQAVSNWEVGKTQPDIETLTMLAECFGITVEELIYGKAGKENVPNISVSQTAKTGIGFGTALAMVISYTHWQSIGWAIFHGLLNWVYVIYYILMYKM